MGQANGCCGSRDALADAEPVLSADVQLTRGCKRSERRLLLLQEELVVTKLRGGTTLRPQLRLALDQLWVLSDGKEAAWEEEVEGVGSREERSSLIFLWPRGSCTATFGSQALKELWVHTLLGTPDGAKKPRVTLVPSLKLLEKELSRRHAWKPFSTRSLERLVEGQAEADLKQGPPTVPSSSEGGLCHSPAGGIITISSSSSRRRRGLPWPFALRRSPAAAPVPGQAGSGCSRALFGQPLAALCGEDGTLPRPIQELLAVLQQEGPSTEGIFRRAAGGTELRELREALDCGADVDLGSQPALLLAAILKDFLRSIPCKLLVTDLYEDWMAAMQKASREEKIWELRAVAEKLPAANLLLLKRLLSLLQHIGHHAATSRMGCSNLAVCVGPNLLSPAHADLLPLEAMLEVTHKVNVLVEFLVENCRELFEEEAGSLSSPADKELPAPLERFRDLSLEEKSVPAGKVDTEHRAEAFPHAPPSLLGVLTEAGGDTAVESETGEAPPALPPATPESMADSLGRPEELARFPEERRDALADAEPVLSADVQLTRGCKRSERRLLLLQEELVVTKLRGGTTLRPQLRLALDQLWVLSDGKEAAWEEEVEGVGSREERSSLIFLWPRGSCTATFGSQALKELWVHTLLGTPDGAKKPRVTLVPSLKLLEKELSRRHAWKPFSTRSLERLVEGQAEADLKQGPPTVPSSSEGGLCHSPAGGIITISSSSSRRRRGLPWPFALRRSPAAAPVPGQAGSGCSRALFGQPLAALCGEDGTLPRPIQELLAVLQQEGPSTEGIFRRAAGGTELRELREALDCGADVDLGSQPALLLAAILKDFLRSIPCKLLVTDLYEDWMAAMQKASREEKIWELRAVAEKLPAANLLLLKRLLSLLQHIGHHAATSRMGCSNLAVCVGPNLLSPAHADLLPLEAMLEVTHKVNVLVEFLVENCRELFEEEAGSLSSPADKELPAPLERFRDLSLEEKSVPAGKVDTEHRAEAFPHAPPSLLGVLTEAGGDTAVESETGEAPPALPPATPESMADSLGRPEELARFPEERRDALADAEPVLSADVQLTRGCKRSERRLLLLQEELVVTKLRSQALKELTPDGAKKPRVTLVPSLKLLEKELSRRHAAGSGCSRALFGQPLAALCGEDGTLPRPIQELLAVLQQEGPSTEGIFRRAAGGTELRELREALDCGADVDLGSQPALLLAAILKDFLRSIPCKLLVTDLYEDWMAAMQKASREEKIWELRAVAEKLPAANLLLLKRLLSLLQHIGHHAATSRMGCSNLAVCVGPNLLSPAHADLLPLEAMLEVTHKVPTAAKLDALADAEPVLSADVQLTRGCKRSERRLLLLQEELVVTKLRSQALKELTPDGAKKPRVTLVPSLKLLEKELSRRHAAGSGCSRALFGQPLAALCGEDGTLPRPIQELLAVLQQEGPSTEGIFRRAAGGTELRELREALDCGADVDLGSQPALLLAAILKDFLRSIPCKLLVTDLYEDWMAAMQKASREEKIWELRAVAEKLPAANLLLLKRLLSLLQHIGHHAATSRMGCSNLAVCVGPNLLSPAHADLLPLEAMLEVTHKVPTAAKLDALADAEPVLSADVQLTRGCKRSERRLLLLQEELVVTKLRSQALKELTPDGAKKPRVTLVPSLKLLEKELSRRHAAGSGCSRALFGQPLAALCGEDGTLPRPIQELLAVLQQEGPSTEGIFRRAAGGTELRELREALDCGADVDLGSQPALLLAAILKDFLRSIPCKLLVTDLYEDWMAAMQKASREEKIWELRAVAEKLPAANLLLLKRLLSLLQHIGHHAATSRMGCSNLAVCVGPNLLSPAHADLLPLEAMLEVTHKVPTAAKLDALADAEPVLSADVQLTRGCKRSERRLLLLQEELVVTKLRSQALKELTPDGAKKPRVTLVPSLKLLEKELSRRHAWKPFSTRSLERLVEGQAEADLKQGPPTVPSSSEGGLCHSPAGGIITISSSSSRRRRGLPWPFALRRSPAAAPVPGQAGSGCSRALFGQPLAALCGEDGTLPRPIQELLAVLQQEGPSTEGIFRRAAGGTELRELREALDCGADVDLGSQPALLLAAILKDFLRSIPCKLLVTDLYEDWMAAMQKASREEKIWELRAVAEKLPAANLLLLKRLLSLLQHIGHHAATSRMGCSNLAVCVGPNLLSPAHADLLPLEAMLEVTHKFSGQGRSGGHQYGMTLLEVSPEGSSQAGPASSRQGENSPRHPTASPPSSPQGTLSPHEQGAAEPEAVGGLLPEVWAALFQRQAHLLDPVLAWLRQELWTIHGPMWWHTRRAMGNIVHALCVSGPVEEAMVRVLQPGLGERAAPLAHGIIDIIVSQCSEEARRLLRSPAVGEEGERSEANSSPIFFSCSCSWCRTGNTSSSSHDSSNREEEAGMSEAALRGGQGHPPSAPVLAEQEQPQEELGEAAAAGPSARGCSRSPCAPRQRRNRSSGRPRRAPKRRAPGSQDSPQPCKRPPRWQH
ncbi:unnamed protein product [Bubo scandiacus]